MKRLLLPAFLLFIGLQVVNGQVHRTDQPLAHTYSIVCFDKNTGEIGVAVQSHWFQVGPIVAWGEAGVGVVATQSLVNPAFGPNGLELMRMGISADKALDLLVDEDQGRAFRQVAMCDAKGNVGAYTGEQCIQPAGHIAGLDFSVQANLMSNDMVWSAMADDFRASAGKPLAERMISALYAAENAGGDIRGKQSAALLVVAAENTNRPWVDRLVDLRVDDHEDPLGELERLYAIDRAYKYMNEGDLAMERKKVKDAVKAYGKAMELNPNNEEMKFWYAVSMANSGKEKKAYPLFEDVFEKNNDWRSLIPRLADSGLLKVDADVLKKISEIKIVRDEPNVKSIKLNADKIKTDPTE